MAYASAHANKSVREFDIVTLDRVRKIDIEADCDVWREYAWEDLSEILKSYERFQIPVTEKLIIQYLQKEEVARDFAVYYQLYCKYGMDCGCLWGRAGDGSFCIRAVRK